MKQGLAVIIFLILITPAYADVKIQTNRGQTFKWKTLTDRGKSYCTWDYGGEFCISKDEVVSISGEGQGYIPPSQEEIDRLKKKKAEDDFKSQETAIKNKIEHDLRLRAEFEEKKKTIPREKLQECLANASNIYQQEWSNKCLGNRQAYNCSLPASTALILDQRFSNNKAECYRIYEVIKKEIEGK